MREVNVMAKKGKPAQTTDPKVIRQRQLLLGGALMLIALLLSIAFISYLYDWKADNSTLGAFTDKTVKAQNLLNKIWSIGESFFCVSRSRIGIHSFSVLTRT